jgi:hypothetical protein
LYNNLKTSNIHTELQGYYNMLIYGPCTQNLEVTAENNTELKVVVQLALGKEKYCRNAKAYLSETNHDSFKLWWYYT